MLRIVDLTQNKEQGDFPPDSADPAPTTERANRAKASFDDVYTAPTPHTYVAKMAEHGYEIGEQARPYCTAAAELLNERNPEAWPAQMLDVGCSYGLGSAFVKYGCSFDEMVSFFASRAPTEYQAACEATRVWLNVTPPACDIRCVGLDQSEPAIQFGVDSGIIDGGISRDFEDPDANPSEEERTWFRSCNLLISTGAIGYVTEKTFQHILPDLGRDHPGEVGPFAVMTVLRMFDVEPIREVFEAGGFEFRRVPGVRLPQRGFSDANEKRKILRLLKEKKIDPAGWEEKGKLYADLYASAPADQLEGLIRTLKNVDQNCEVGFIHR